MEDEELDIPIKKYSMQLELGICMECGKRKLHIIIFLNICLELGWIEE